MTGAAITLDHVTRRFEVADARETVIALDDVSLVVSPGEALGVIGGSGSGKSSLVNMIGAMDRPSAGSVLVDGVDLGAMSTRDRVLFRRQIGVVFQHFHLLPGLSALENVAAPLVPYTRASVARQAALARLAGVGMEGRERARPGQLSGGQQQRVAIARAIVHDPLLLLADEPTGNLDRKTGHAVVDLLFALREERATTLVFVTHDPEIAARCDRIVRLEDGKVVGEGLG